LRNGSGFALLGFPIDPATGQVIGSGAADLRPVTVNEIEAFATPTTEAALDAVLPADFAGTTRIADLAGGSPTRLLEAPDFQTTVQVFDSQGTARSVSIDLFRVNESEPNLWAARVTGDNVSGLQPGKGARFVGAAGPTDADIVTDNVAYLRFNGDGSLENIYVEGAFGPAAEQLTIDPLGAAVTISPLQANGSGQPALSVAVGDLGTDYVLNTAANPVDPSSPFGVGGETRLALPVGTASPFLQNGAESTIFSLDLGTPTGLFGNNDPAATGFAGNGLDGLTSFATASGTPSVAVTSFLQNGTSTSRSTGVSVSSSGVVSAVFENGNSLAIARLPVGEVANPNGLRAVGGTAFAPTAEAGGLQFGSGSIIGGSLESSNVNIEEELVNLIVARAAYSANARVLAENAETLNQIVDVKS
ncbi:MAG: flagellar hook-basal body complex protein, partial [Pseudomonadota bacterium]